MTSPLSQALHNSERKLHWQETDHKRLDQRTVDKLKMELAAELDAAIYRETGKQVGR